MGDTNLKFAVCTAVVAIVAIFLIYQPFFILFQLAFRATIAFCFWKRKNIWIIIKTLPRDLRYLQSMIKIKSENKRFKKENMTPASMLSDLAKERPDDVVLFFKEDTWTYKQLDQLSWKIARCFHKLGYKKGDTVALFSTNRPEYVAFWVGLSRIGVVTALVNNSLKKTALQHSLKVVNSKAVIVGVDLCDAILEIKETIPGSCKLFSFYGNDQQALNIDGLEPLNPLINAEKGLQIESIGPPDYGSALLYIYTSGTTGLPKAAIIKTSRFLAVVVSVAQFGRLTSKDRTYTPLPLYHGAGCVIGVGPAITYGLSCVIRDKFSVSKYWEDCAKYKCTVAQYIGEMCRYLLAAPASPSDTKHQVNKMLGNGLKVNIWQQFLDRFGVGSIKEFYAATEGNCNVVNSEGKVGASGFMPKILPESMIPVALVKSDEITGELIRGKDNLCIRCKPGEPGMFIGRIEENDAPRQYHGYLDKEASAKKVAHDVFSKGDRYFMSGDVLVSDELGYLYFMDRTGDTFRWKGENVSNAEVENAIAEAVGLRDICVYGVEIPQTDGRAGMATVVDEDSTLNLDNLAKSLSSSLPPYAQPIFLRVAKKIDMTTTFKLKKFNLQKENFNPSNVGADSLYYRTGKMSYFEKLTPQIYQDILSGKIKF